MPWIRIDDHFDEHPKLAKVGPLGWAMWLAGLAYCNRNLTDGFIPWSAARALVSWEYLRPHPTEVDKELIYTVDTGTGMKGDHVTCVWVIEMLLDAGIWEECAGGFLVHDYPDYQPTKAQVLADREKIRKRVVKHRGNAVTNGGVTGEDGPSNAGPVPKPKPVPVSKVPKTVSPRENATNGEGRPLSEVALEVGGFVAQLAKKPVAPA